MANHRSRVAALTAAVTLLLASVVPVGSPDAAGAADPLPPFYDVPDTLPTDGPGTVVKTESVPIPGLHGTMQRVMYTSTSLRGETIAVTGLVATPTSPPPPGGYRVLTWAHGTTGMADVCAPSLDTVGAFPAVNALLDRGWLVVGTDYEGLGTPGLHPYIVGDSQARGVIDIVRAARNLSPDVSADYVVWGHSQGGHASMFTAHIAEEWAPELRLVGAVAGAPPSQLGLVYDFLRTSPYKYYLLMVGGAINAAYGDDAAPLDAVLNDEGMALLPLLEQGCAGLLAEESRGLDVDDLLVAQADGTHNPFSNPLWGPLIAAQDPANFAEPVDAPILIIHGGDDEQIPAVSSQLLASQLCASGQNVERWLYPGQTHSGVIGPSLTAMIDWIDARFDGASAPGAAGPSGSAPVEATVCSDGSMAERTVDHDPVPPTDETDDDTPDADPPGPGDDPAPGGSAPVATPVRARPAFTG